MGVQKLTADFVDRVGGDGFRDIKRTKSIFGKSFWIVVFLAAWTMVCYQVYSYVSKYFRYPIDTTVELKFDETANFPAVTFCNLNPVRFSESMALLDGKMKEMIHQEPKDHQKENFKRMGWENVKQAMNNLQPKDLNMDDYDYDFLPVHEENVNSWTPEHHPEEILWENSFYRQYFALKDQQKCKVGHQLEDMLVECVWKQQQCFPENFTHFLHPVYGNCYSFNAGWEIGTEQKCSANARKINNTILTASMPGPSDGLSVMLFAEGEDYIPLLAGSIGVRVHIHSQESPPQPLKTGFTVSGGFSTSLEIRKVAISRLPLPYQQTDCMVGSTGPYHKEIESFWPRAGYTLATCVQECYQETLKAKCKCVDSAMFYFGNKRDLKACDMNSTAQGRCVMQYESAFRNGNASLECRAKCSQPCSETDFDVQISSAQWPNHYYLEILKQSAALRNNKMETFVDKGEDNKLKENLLKVDVYFQSLNYKAIVEEPSYLLVDMLADLGGAVDLWVGMSVLAMLQCIEYILELLQFLCCMSNSHKKSSHVSPRQYNNTKKLQQHKHITPEKPTLKRHSLPGYNSHEYDSTLFDGVGQPFYDETSARPPRIM